MATTATIHSSKIKPLLQFVFWSLLGSFVFFFPIRIDNNTTIPLDYMVTLIRNNLPWFGPVFTLIILTIGGILPFCDRSWNRDNVSIVLSILKLLGIGAGCMAYFGLGPEWLLKDEMLPSLWTNVAVYVAIIVPIGSIFLTFILCYGLLEFIGVLFRPIMRPVYRLPGRSAVDAVTSFVGSFAIAMILTNRLYKEGKYTEREAAIILTGFSSVSASFMISVAKTLGLLDIWITFFLTSMMVTYLVTAITVRLHPIRKIRDEYIEGTGIQEGKPEGNILKKAFIEGLTAAENAGSLTGNIWKNLKDGMAMNFRLISTIISIGLISFVLVKTTPVFDYLGYIFYPFAYLVQVPDPELVAKLTAVAGAEMFIPSLTVAEVIGVAAQTKFVVGVISISLILFFSGSIPCVLATDVRLGLKNILIIMFERAVLSLLIAGAVAYLIF